MKAHSNSSLTIDEDMTATIPGATFHPVVSGLIGAALLFGLYLTSLHSYILFHYLAEIFSILVSFAIFTFAWNTYSFVRSSYLIVLGVAYLFVGSFDLLHTLSYKGMGIIGDGDTNLPTQLWIIARGIESISLFIAPYLLNKRLKRFNILVLYTLVFMLLLGSLIPINLFPDCYIVGEGLTPFKKICEYIICAILAAAGLKLYVQRQSAGTVISKLIIASIGFTILSELMFTLYVSVYALSNLLGHMFKIISFYLVYRAIVAYGLLAPYKTMFKEINEGKLAIARHSQKLEVKVSERTQALENSNLELKALSAQLFEAQENERKRIAQELHDGIGQALSSIKIFAQNAVLSIGKRLNDTELETVNQLVPAAQSAIDEMRTILKGLRPCILDDLGILATIKWQCREFETLNPQIKIELNLQLLEQQISEEIKTVIFRLLQEALHNVTKHSCAQHVSIFLGRRNESISFQVVDNGCGFDPRRENEKLLTRSGFGLASMRERAMLSGAEFDITTHPGHGTKITASWPLSI